MSDMGLDRKLLRPQPRTLAVGLMQTLSGQIRDGLLSRGEKLPTEAAIMATFGVSRTVVREALSQLQAARLVETRHGIGTFVAGQDEPAPFRLSADQVATLTDVIAVLELRIGIETEAAALAARRRNHDNLAAMRQALAAFATANAAGQDAVAADFAFHLAIARATQNGHFVDLMQSLGPRSIPRLRLDEVTDTAAAPDDASRAYLLRVNAEHEMIFDAIAAGDSEAARAATRTHLSSSRERHRRLSARQDPLR